MHSALMVAGGHVALGALARLRRRCDQPALKPADRQVAPARGRTRVIYDSSGVVGGANPR